MDWNGPVIDLELSLTTTHLSICEKYSHQLVDSFDQDALLFIANALYFKDSWLYTFEDEDLSGNPITGGFSYLDGRKENIEMMQLTSSYIKYERFEIESLNGKAFEVVKIPYKNQKFQMKIMMPAGEPRDLMWLEHFTEMTFARDLRTEEDFNLFRTVNEEEFDGVSETINTIQNMFMN